MTKRSLFLGVLLVSFLAGVAKAEGWVFDPLHSKIEFTASSRLTKTDGQFRKFTVKANVNDEALEKSRMLVTIDVASLDTDNESRDEHLRTKDFFDVEAYPSATIKVNGVRKVSPSDYQASAAVTIHGVTRTVALPMKIVAFENGVLRFQGATEISRKDFGIGTDTAGSLVNVANPLQDLVAIRYEMDLRKPAPPRPRAGTAAVRGVR